MSAEQVEIDVTAVAAHPVHGRVIVFERSKKFVFVAPVVPEYPFYGQDFAVPVDEYERDYKEEAPIELEAQCEACGATCNLSDIPDHEISRADAEWHAAFKLHRCCGGASVTKIRFEWVKGSK